MILTYLSFYLFNLPEILIFCWPNLHLVIIVRYHIKSSLSYVKIYKYIHESLL